MGTVTVGTTPVQLDDGSHPYVYVGNTGQAMALVTIGSKTEPFERGYSRRLETGGVAVTARTILGTTTLAIATTGSAPSPSGGVTQQELEAAVAEAVSEDLGTAATRDVGTTTGTVAAGDDPRMSDARTPTAHASSHGQAGTDALTLAQAQVTGLDAALAARATLVGGKVPTAQLPSLAIGETLRAADEAAMLALEAEHGDVAVREDEGLRYILVGDPTVLNDWIALDDTNGVLSVAGRNGVVTLTTSDVGGLSTALTGKADSNLGNVPGATIRTVAGLGTSATRNVGTTTGAVAAGDDARFSDQRVPTDGSVTTAKLADDSVTEEKLHPDVAAAIGAGGVIPDGSITIAKLDAAVIGTTAGTLAAGNDSRITGAAPTASPTFTGTVTVPAAAVDTAAARYGQLPTYPDGTTKATTVGRSRNVDLRDRGSVADGATNNGPALLSALNSAKSGRSTMPFSLSSDAVGNVSIYLPAGDYVVTDIGGLLGQEAMSAKGRGLRIFGDGAELTRVIFKPSSAGDLMQNDYWINLQVEGIGFYAATAGCTFMHSNTTHNGQRMRFVNCYFKGWKYGFYLEGNNNNSEFTWINCHNDAMQDDGAFLRIPSTGSDQFLNYWFYGCTHWSTDAPFIDADKGGHFKIYGLDASDWGASLASTGYLFRLAGSTHALGVCTFIADGVRVEAKNAFAALLNSAWPQGNVAFRGTDWSSQAGTYTYGDIIKISYSNVDGAHYSFRDCNLAGGVLVAFAVNDWAHSHRIVFEDCQWRQKTSPSDVVTYDTSAAGINVVTKPPVEFLRCRGTTAVDITSAGGAAIWDATIGYAGETLQTLRQRCVSARDVYGTPNSQVLTVVLPVGALITGFEALSPAGAVAEADGGSWALATTEGSPTTIATATVSGAMSAGYDVNTTLAAPFLCDSSAKAKVTITPSSVSQNNSKALLLIKGYW